MTRVTESARLPCPIARAWALITALNFDWWRAVDGQASTPLVVSDVGLCGAIAQVAFTDGSWWRVQLVEHSEITHTVLFDVVDAAPALGCMSQLHGITLQAVTSTDETLVEWVTDFTSDATAELVVDARFKRIEALADLIATVSA